MLLSKRSHCKQRYEVSKLVVVAMMHLLGYCRRVPKLGLPHAEVVRAAERRNGDYMRSQDFLTSDIGDITTTGDLINQRGKVTTLKDFNFATDTRMWGSIYPSPWSLPSLVHRTDIESLQVSSASRASPMSSVLSDDEKDGRNESEVRNQHADVRIHPHSACCFECCYQYRKLVNAAGIKGVIN
jgi:hypothetical protein